MRRCRIIASAARLPRTCTRRCTGSIPTCGQAIGMASKALPSSVRDEQMTNAYVLWIATAAYGLHILEEYELNWRAWARNVLKLPVDWDTFYVVNALVLVFGACCAMVGWQRPEF